MGSDANARVRSGLLVDLSYPSAQYIHEPKRSLSCRYGLAWNPHNGKAGTLLSGSDDSHICVWDIGGYKSGVRACDTCCALA